MKAFIADFVTIYENIHENINVFIENIGIAIVHGLLGRFSTSSLFYRCNNITYSLFHYFIVIQFIT